MSASQHEMVRRVAAAQAVIDALQRQPFVWGKADCGRSIVAPVLKAMGHKCPLAPFGAYSTEFGARRALKRNGYDSIEGFLDKRLMRIGYASCLPADLIGMQGEGGWLGIAVVLSNRRAFGFVNGFGHVLQPLKIETAWRVPCCS